MNALIRSSLTALMLTLSSLSAQAATAQKVCVYDMLGAAGDLFSMTKDYVLAMQKFGANITLKGYTDERQAAEDYRAGQCDGVITTAFRARQFNRTSGAIDTLGATTIVRDGKIDMPGSYEVVRKLIQTYASPAARALMVEGEHEVGGILPLGAAYPMVHDRRINTVEALVGKRIASFDHDKAQAIMIKRIGAVPVSADITTFANKFNSGLLDMVASPTIAYKPLELYRGLGESGAIVRFPLMILTYQMIFNKTRFPEGMGEVSRTYWLSQFDRALQFIKQADNSVPPTTWSELSAENAYKYSLMLRESRIDIAQQGVYDKRGLKVIKRVRCNVNPGDPECSTKSEEEWRQ
ncbi:putative solute-binding protein [Aquabacterium sp.]|uniref:putative solute-binding protein n=1 Tax=Aquabacterium sp. TaxID=1872578 RepID=UPI002488C31D|nr:putative solute-binding protein [Aquabacterium sp.]MDI1261253.1 DUF6091 family protein [Aquabacterium sp.]